MNNLDSLLLDELADLPGWDEMTASPAPPLAPEVLRRVTAAVRGAIAADASRATSGDIPAVQRTTLTRRRRGRWVLVAVATAASVAIVIAVPTISTPVNPPVSVASATEFLTRLASSTTASPGLDDAYWKVRFATTHSQPDAPSGSGRATTMWYGSHGGRWITSADGTAVKASNTHNPFVVGERLALTWNQVTDLPSDPGQLERRLRSTLGQTSVATGAARLLAIAPLSATQRSALFTILARQPGVTIRPGIPDGSGRTGTALGFPFGPTATPSELLTLLLADDGTLLEITETAIRDQQIPSTAGPAQTITNGSIISRTIYLEVGGTNTAPGT